MQIPQNPQFLCSQRAAKDCMIFPMQRNFETVPKARNASQFPEVVRARAPRGFSEAVKKAAAIRKLSTSEFVRRVLAEKISHTKSEAQ